MKRKYISVPKVQSPCVSVCAMDDETGYCRGCMRTIAEITGWDRFDDLQRRVIIADLAHRHAEKDIMKSS